MKLGSEGLALIRSFETFCPHVYDDARPMVKGRYPEWKGGVVRGELTIGYGHTEAAGPPKITRGLRMTADEALAVLEHDMDAVEADVNRVVTLPLTQAQFDALCSFHFNCYGLILRNGKPSTCCRVLNDGNRIGGMDELERWNKAQGVICPGLTRRRAAERALFEGRDWREFA